MRSSSYQRFIALMLLESLLHQSALVSGKALNKTQSAKAVPSPVLDKPQNAKKCGPGAGRCPSGQCCSGAGYCGTGESYCEGSQCQLDYSDNCDSFSGPSGGSTEKIPRPHRGKVPYGTVIRSCSTPGTVALTFDDGPYDYTRQLLDMLDEAEVKATFFVAGNNRGKGSIDDDAKPWRSVLQRMYDAGHQIGSHTWTHRNLNEVNSTVQRSEIIYNEMALRNIFGWVPTYMRPPYLECGASSGCTKLMDTLGYHIIEDNIDTKDYENDDEKLISTSRDRFSEAVSSSESKSRGYIVLAHDVHYQTVVNLVPFMIKTAKERGYKLVTVGECLGDPKEYWYRTVEGASVSSSRSQGMNPTKTSGGGQPSSTTTSYAKPTKTDIVSKNQTCGGEQGQTCRGSKYGDCCSHYGYCGSGPAYCGTGCDPNFGSCTPVEPGILDTTNGLCGVAFKASCANYGEKSCCSAAGFCGDTPKHCEEGCQQGYGRCDSAKSR